MSSVRVAILGGGVSGCSILNSLRKIYPKRSTSPNVKVDLFEMGRGVGGRAATRISRSVPWLRLNHGAPYLELSLNSPALPTVESLCEMKALVPWDYDKFPVGQLVNNGTVSAKFVPSAFSEGHQLHFTAPNGMNQLCEALSLTGQYETDSKLDEAVSVHFRFKTMVKGIEYTPKQANTTNFSDTDSHGGGIWLLRDREQQVLGEYDWLFVTGSAVAHPRWASLSGGDPPPLRVVADSCAHASLSASLDIIKDISADPVHVAMMAFDKDSAGAQALSALPFAVAAIADDHPSAGTLRKVVISRLEGGQVSCVLHSSRAFSEAAADTFGATSTAARIAKVGSGGAEREAELCDALLKTAADLLGSEAGVVLRSCVTSAESMAVGLAYGPHIHRWGAAFPVGAPLSSAGAALPELGLCFAGDFVQAAGAGFGSVESALLSGQVAAQSFAEKVGVPSSL